MKYHIRHILCNIALVFIGERSMATTNKLNFFRFFFISILGVLLHFTYEWSNDNPAVGLFSAVNESTWEHLKLIFFPMLLLTMIEFLWAHIKDKPPAGTLSSSKDCRYPVRYGIHCGRFLHSKRCTGQEL